MRLLPHLHIVWLSSPFFCNGVLSASFVNSPISSSNQLIESSHAGKIFGKIFGKSSYFEFPTQRHTDRKLSRAFLQKEEEWDDTNPPSESWQSSAVESKSTTTTGKEWSTADDWSSLSSQIPGNAIPDTESLYNSDVVGVAARAMEQQQEMYREEKSSEEDVFLEETVDQIYHNTHNPDDPSLYDTTTSLEQSSALQQKNVDFTDDAGREVSLLVRCNERPEDLLINEGRALPPLTDDDKYDVSHLMIVDESNEHQMTDFFDNAISKIFNDHATSVPKKKTSNEKGNDKERVLDRGAIASWMSKSLGSNDDGYNDVIGKHDKRVTTVISRYGTYGTGYLTMPEFRQLYIDAVLSGLKGNMERNEKPKATWKIANDNNMEKLKLKQPTVKSVWRDFYKHGILSPAEEERKRLAMEIDERHGGSTSKINSNTLMDECEILEWGDHDHSDPRSSVIEGKFGSSTRVADGGAKKKKSSHELVELASDNKTPKRIRDGKFVFIDEETCIGCTQCAQIAPSSFVMLDTGRARTFAQSNAPENNDAISACPVNCMHKVAFHELKEMETSRDHGDGRTDHRHMGHSKRHTPLNVAGIDSDANHKSSWYHYLKQKCYISSSCPQRGCYDCPMYSAPGENPYFQKKHRAAEKIRAKDFIDSGEADIYRNTADL